MRSHQNNTAVSKSLFIYFGFATLSSSARSFLNLSFYLILECLYHFYVNFCFIYCVVLILNWQTKHSKSFVTSMINIFIFTEA